MINHDTKARAIIIVSKIELTEKILDECLKTNKKYLLKNHYHIQIKIKKILVYSENIFVLYNRRFYKSVNYIKKFLKNQKKIFILM